MTRCATASGAGSRRTSGPHSAATARQTLHKIVRAQVEEGASVYTDALGSYAGLNRDYDHGVVDHAVRYVIGRVHVNSVENFWTLLKRGIKGTYVQVAPSHLFRYVDERVFTYN